MKNRLSVSVMLSCAALANSPQLGAQEADYELVTTAIHRRSSDTALPVTILSGEELQQMSTATLGETLSWQPGIHNASFGPAVGQTVIRGQQGRRVLNMNNAIPSADASGNSADHAIAIEPVLADSIEVLRGPSTLLYGGGAIGGVVNVIDSRIAGRLPETSTLSVEARHDTAADLDTFVGRTDIVSGDFVFHADAVKRDWNDLDIPGYATAPGYLDEHDEDHEEEDEEEHGDEDENTFGHIDNSGGKTRTLTAGLSRVFDQGFIGFSVSSLDNFYGLPAGAHAHEEEEHEEDHEDEDHSESVFIDMESMRYDLAGEWRSANDSLIEKASYRLSYTDYEHSELEGDEIGTTFTNKSWQQRIQLTHRDLSGWHGVLGLQSAIEEFGAVGDESFIPVTDITSHGLFLVEDYHTGNLIFEFGARINRDQYKPELLAAPTRHFTSSSFSGSGLWDLHPSTTLGLNVSRSERAPSIEELYSNHNLADVGSCVIHLATGSCEIGDDRLARERSLNTDLTAFFDFGKVSLTVTAFHNEFTDYIFLSNTGLEVDEYPVRSYIQSDARFSGLELDVVIALSEQWQLKFFGDSIDSHISGHGEAPRMPPGRIGSELRFADGNWSIYTAVMHAKAQNDPGENELPTAGYTRWDAGVDYRLQTGSRGELHLFLKGRNLGDEEIRLATSFLRGFAPEAGRSVETGIRYHF